MEVPAALARVLYSTEEARLGTFDRWPLVSKTATPKRLAQAGFFHNPCNEHPDRCTCFTCGVALMSWEPTDIPLEEHRRHAGHCEFINSRFPPGAARDDTTDDEEEETDGEGRSAQPQPRRAASSSTRRGSGVADATLGASSSGATTAASRWESSTTRCVVRGGVAQDLLFGPLFGAGLRPGWTCCDNLSTSSEEGSRDDDSTEWEEGSGSREASPTPPPHASGTTAPKGGSSDDNVQE